MQVQGEAWTKRTLGTTRMWDRDGEPNAYHAAQLVTIDLDSGEQRFHRPHALCGLDDMFMKLNVGRSLQPTHAMSISCC